MSFSCLWSYYIYQVSFSKLLKINTQHYTRIVFKKKGKKIQRDMSRNSKILRKDSLLSETGRHTSRLAYFLMSSILLTRCRSRSTSRQVTVNRFSEELEQCVSTRWFCQGMKYNASNMDIQLHVHTHIYVFSIGFLCIIIFHRWNKFLFLFYFFGYVRLCTKYATIQNVHFR